MNPNNPIAADEAERSIFRLQLIIGVLVLGVFVAIRRWIPSPVAVQAVSSPVYLGALIPSGLLYFVIISIRSQAARLALFCFFAAFVLVFVLPLRNNELTLGLSVLWLSTSAVLSFRRPPLRIVSLIVSSVTFALQTAPVSMWRTASVAPAAYILPSLIVLQIVMSIVGWALRDAYSARVALSDRIEYLVVGADQLFTANIGFQQYAASARTESALEERKRISRDIHDSVGHSLINVIMILQDAYDHAPDESRLGMLIHQARLEAQKALVSTRGAVRMLRQSVSIRKSLSNQIYELSQIFEKATGVRVKLEFGNMPASLAENTEIAVYSVVQEAFTNAVRHGRATLVEVRFWVSEHVLAVVIEDDGQGVSNIREGVGIQSMKERISGLRGTIDFKSEPGRGFATIARVPMVSE